MREKKKCVMFEAFGCKKIRNFNESKTRNLFKDAK